MEFGPLEYAILGNGALLLLLFIILSYTIHRLRRVSSEKKRLRSKSLNCTQTVSGQHENFSTLCGLGNGNSQPGSGMSGGGMMLSQTLPHPLKKSVRISEEEMTTKGTWGAGGNGMLSSFILNTPPQHQQPQQQQSPLWIAFPHQTPYFPGQFATLNIPVKKGKGHRCQRAHSCRTPQGQVAPLHAYVNPPTHSKKLNLEQFYGKY